MLLIKKRPKLTETVSIMHVQVYFPVEVAVL